MLLSDQRKRGYINRNCEERSQGPGIKQTLTNTAEDRTFAVSKASLKAFHT